MTDKKPVARAVPTVRIAGKEIEILLDSQEAAPSSEFIRGLSNAWPREVKSLVCRWASYGDFAARHLPRGSTGAVLQMR